MYSSNIYQQGLMPTSRQVLIFILTLFLLDHVSCLLILVNVNCNIDLLIHYSNKKCVSVTVPALTLSNNEQLLNPTHG